MARYLLIAAVVAYAGVASAQTAQERAACSADAKKLCANVAPGGGRLLDCLGQQKSKVSAACQKVLEAHGK
jgi:hypothetical protein